MREITLFVTFFTTLWLTAQDISLALQKPEVVSDDAKRAEWLSVSPKIGARFGSTNQRYPSDRIDTKSLQTCDTLVAWRGERVHTQVLIWSAGTDTKFSVSVGRLKSDTHSTLSPKAFTIGTIGYTMTDEFAPGCGHRRPQDFDSFMVADIIHTGVRTGVVAANTVQPVWISLRVPETAAAGTYSTTVTVKAGGAIRLPLVVRVLDRQLPPASRWKFELDLWQHPAAIARVHGVKRWSKQHFRLMRPYMTMLAAAGQKNITASIVEEPWGHQTYDDFPSLIGWTKRKDGSWSFDYTLFDRYVEFVMSCGIGERINCYSMVPWKIAFPYFDETTGKTEIFTHKIGSPEYNAFWAPMLTDFTRHLKAKGWFAKTVIAMDERPMAAMQAVIGLLKSIDPEWKIALAGDYHPEIEQDIFDYCVASRWVFPHDVLQRRRSEGKRSTWYTCCTEKYPNGFTFSPPAEHVWLGWYTAASGMDGYLRWAYNSWPADALADSRFTAWPAGDTFQVYPGPRSSIRFEKLIEGIQDYEKLQILIREAHATRNTELSEQIEGVLDGFKIQLLSGTPAERMVLDAKQKLFEQ